MAAAAAARGRVRAREPARQVRRRRARAAADGRGRRGALAAAAAAAALARGGALGPGRARADDAQAEFPEPLPRSVAPFDISELGPEEGWEELPSGLRSRVLREGAGDAAAGILDPVGSFSPFPFVEVVFAAYDNNGREFASTAEGRRASTAYQVGIHQWLEDEDGAVMSMLVGERRQFAVPFELVLENVGGGKVFGARVPDGAEAVLVDVQLLSLRPY